MKRLLCLLGFHECKDCIEVNDYGLGGDTKIVFHNPRSNGTRYTNYQCKCCNRKFWMPKCNFEELKSKELFINKLSKI